MESKRLILAIVLSIAVWYLWMHFFSPPKPEKQEITTVNNEKEIETNDKKNADKVLDLKDIPSIKAIPSKIDESQIDVETEKYKITLSNKGGIIKNFIYKERNVDLIVPNKQHNAKGIFDFSIFFTENEFLQGNSLEDTIWDYTKSDDIIKFYTSLSLDGKSIQVQKTYKFFKDNYYFLIEYNLINISNKAIPLPNDYLIVSPTDFLGPNMDFDNRYNKLNQIYYLNSDFKKVQKGSGFFSKAGIVKKESGDIKWAGVMSRYFLLIMLADNSSGNGVICDNRETSGYRTGIFIPVDNIQPGEKQVETFKVYVGEKNKDKLSAVDPSLKDAADVSKWIEPIRDLLLWCLIKINIVFGNYGWSLVVFSILTKIILLPLTMRSTESMKRMQALSPKMNELKEKYKGKPDVLNKEMMKLYKANKINPLGGCLPLLVQMPFFFALYSALINSIELWQAPFILWIKDLSLPDTVFKISGFNINILPIIMTGTSFLQQKFTPIGGAGQQQKMMTMLMPLIFIIIFWNMPSGLVLYWTLQNIMTILHQLYTNRKTVKEA